MPDRAPRVRWSARHRRQMWWAEKIGYAALLVFGLTVATYFVVRLFNAMEAGTEITVVWLIPSGVGVGVASIGLWGFFPSGRPFISDMLDRLPLTAKKTDDGPRLEG